MRETSDVLSFFFSSRRRHTRYIGDWSSDVCSSDLRARGNGRIVASRERARRRHQLALLSPERRDARQIGRASCRERVESTVVAVPFKTKKGKTMYGRKKDTRKGNRESTTRVGIGSK